MKRAIIFGNGEIKNYKKIENALIESLRLRTGKRLLPEQAKRVEGLANSDLIICADGGARHALKLNLIPNVIIGDMDSITPAVRKRLEKNPDIKWINYPQEKVQTDSQLAIDYALTKKYQTLTFCGFTGGRTDHFLSTLFYLASQSIAHIEILSEQENMYIMRNRFMLKGKIGQLFSLIPILGDVKGITLTGARYPLKNETLKLGSTRGVSNVFLRTKIIIICTKSANPLLVTTHR